MQQIVLYYVTIFQNNLTKYTKMKEIANGWRV